MTTLRKGVNIIEGQGVSVISGLSNTVTGMMGVFQKGPLNKAVVVGSLAEFQRVFGSRPVTGVTSYYDVEGFFHEAGEAPLAVIGVKGPAAARAFRIIQDIDASPKDTLKIWAKYFGDDGNKIAAAVTEDNILVTGLASNAGLTSAILKSVVGLEIGSVVKFDNGSNNEKVILTAVNPQTNEIQWTGNLANNYTPANTSGKIKSQEFQIGVFYNMREVERWRGLSMNEDVTFHCEKAVADRSDYITVEDMDSVSTPLSDQWPAFSATATLLTGGSDDLTGIEEAHWSGTASAGTGLFAFSGVNNLFRVGIPNPKINTSPDTGYETVVQNLHAFAAAQGFLQVYQCVPYNTTQANAVLFAAKFEGRRLSLWYPWIKRVVSGQVLWIAPTGPVLGASARKDAQRGIFKNIGNESISYGSDIERYSDVTQEEILNDANINTIKVQNGLRTWGGRTKSATTNYRFINHSEQFNELAQVLKSNVADVSFEPNNSATWAKLTRRLTAFFRGKVQEGGIIDFVIKCDATNNPSDKVADGILSCEIEYQPAGVAEKIAFTITSSPGGLVSVVE